MGFGARLLGGALIIHDLVLHRGRSTRISSAGRSTLFDTTGRNTHSAGAHHQGGVRVRVQVATTARRHIRGWRRHRHLAKLGRQTEQAGAKASVSLENRSGYGQIMRCVVWGVRCGVRGLRCEVAGRGVWGVGCAVWGVVVGVRVSGVGVRMRVGMGGHSPGMVQRRSRHGPIYIIYIK